MSVKGPSGRSGMFKEARGLPERHNRRHREVLFDIGFSSSGWTGVTKDERRRLDCFAVDASGVPLALTIRLRR